MSSSILEIEAIVCGFVMRDKDSLADAIGRGLEARHFSDNFYSSVFDACRRLWEDGEPADLESISRRVGRDKIDNLSLLLRSAPLTQNFAPYAQAVLNSCRANMIGACLADVSHMLVHRKPMDSIGPAIDKLSEAIVFAGGQNVGIKTRTMDGVLESSIVEKEKRIEQSKAGKPPGVRSGFQKIDFATYGFQPGFVYILGARTSVGKTTLATTIAVNAAESGAKVSFVTVEMSDVDIADKMISRLSKVNIGNYLSGDLDEEELNRLSCGIARMRELKILFTEVVRPKIEALEFEIMRQVMVEKVDMVIIDYLQLFETGNDNRFKSPREETKLISSKLKSLARRLNVPLLVLTQLNRQAPEDGMPDLVHIAESDQIARDADVVMFLYRDSEEYFLSIAKNRRGKKGTIGLNARLEFSSFEEKQ